MSGFGLRAATVGFGLLLLVVIGSAAASSNDISGTALSEHSSAITASDLAPAACANIPLANIVSGAGTLNGTEGNDLILGADAANTIHGNGGNDCILGGGGDDTIDGGDGWDVCLGGPGSNTLINCE